MIAEAAASVPLFLFDGESEVDEHPLLALLAKPNPAHCAPDLFEAWYGHLLVAGNAYLEAVSVDGAVRELHVLRPDRMKVVPAPTAGPRLTTTRSAARRCASARTPSGGVRPILHLALFHPLNDHYGMSPLEAAAAAIDIHNASGAWNKALLDNSACPSGALVYSAKDGQLTPGAVRAAEGRARSELPRREECRPAAAARRRARLEGDGLLAQGHGFHRGQARRRARDGAGARRAADAARHSRRQYLFQLRRGQSHLLAADDSASGDAHGEGDFGMAWPGLR